ncbi:MAG: hypothetical protein EOP88_26280 [Verrucomicrobiaceae bacterium]|nr:MAG: hypothetical protein EOP88_26280 [Verrucomicrobiaceae bacterium]
MRPVIINCLHLLAGIMIGTALSFPLNGIPLTEKYFAALILSPFYLTLLLPLVFIDGNVWIGIATAIGATSAIFCSVMAYLGRNKQKWRFGTAIGGVLWSLGSALVMEVSSGV